MIKVEEYILENSKKMFAIDVKGHSKEILAVPINIALEAISLAYEQKSRKIIEAHKECCPLEYRNGRCNITQAACDEYCKECGYMQDFIELINAE